MFSALASLLYPLEWITAWIMVHVHQLLTTVGMPATSGWTWVLSIVGLVVVVRIVLIPLFVKQIHASRGMTLLQPEMKKITAKYKGKTDQESRQAQSRETMELYKAHGTNPFASCLPILLQLPVFFALFRVLNNGIREHKAVGPLTEHLARQAGDSTIFGVKLVDTFTHFGDSSAIAARLLTAALIIVMSISTFWTQRQLMMKNMPASALDNPFAQQQKMIMYVYPVIFAVTGINFPVGQLVYWLATNLWTGAQQFYVIRRMPSPGSPAEAALEARRARRRAARNQPRDDDGSAAGALAGATISSGATAASVASRSGQRVQPKRKGRGRPSTPGSTAGSTAAGPTGTSRPEITSPARD